VSTSAVLASALPLHLCGTSIPPVDAAQYLSSPSIPHRRARCHVPIRCAGNRRPECAYRRRRVIHHAPSNTARLYLDGVDCYRLRGVANEVSDTAVSFSPWGSLITPAPPPHPALVLGCRRQLYESAQERTAALGFSFPSARVESVRWSVVLRVLCSLRSDKIVIRM
jgi:hypothetical protein